MEQKRTLKLFYLLAFVAFAGVSCWATSESLQLLLPSWPAIMCWIVTIGFFVIASLGTKMIVDSLNQHIYLEKRGARLFGGILITLIFWLICSMPTNTHTLFYRSSIADVVLQDVATTKGYMERLRDNVKIEETIKSKHAELDAKISAKLGELEAELNNPNNPGNGPKVRSILSEISQILECEPISPLSGNCNTPTQRRAAYQQYVKVITKAQDYKKELIVNRGRHEQEGEYRRIAEAHVNILNEVEKKVAEMGAMGDVDNNLIQQADVQLKNAYTTIKTYQDFIIFDNQEDSDLYCANDQVTKVTKMLSVIDVWKDFIDGRWAGRGFIFWVIISILVDVAAFIFFDLAFKREE